MTHTETVRKRKQGDGVTQREREVDGYKNREKTAERENKRTS